MTQLSVNVNKLATLRNARGGSNPDPVSWAKKISGYGPLGITVHPRPDQRHIRTEDVFLLKETLPQHVDLNIEGYPTNDFLKLINQIQPHQCTLVPDPPEVLTSNAGWDISENKKILLEARSKIPDQTIISTFVEPHKFNSDDANFLKANGLNRIEMYTETYANAFSKTKLKPTISWVDFQKNYSQKDNNLHSLYTVLQSYIQLYQIALDAGLGVNAGHDLNSSNLGLFAQALPLLNEVSIGHALICEALEIGMKKTVENYLFILQDS